MPSSSDNSGAGRGEIARAILGKPGSFRRWVAGTALWLLVCLVLSLYVGWMGRIGVFLIAVAVPIAARNTQSQLIGDEDELGAYLRRKRREVPPPTVPANVETRLAQDDWVSVNSRGFEGAPPPPVAEEAVPSSAPNGTSPAEPTR